MRLLSKAEACRVLRVSLSTLDRRIAAGEVPVKKEPRGRRHRVYVMLDDDSPGNGKVADQALVAAQERIRELEVQVAILQGQLDRARQRYADLADELEAARTGAAQKRMGPWWRFRGS